MNILRKIGEAARLVFSGTLAHKREAGRMNPELEESILRARKVQEMGFDVGFAYLPRYPDAPPLHVCLGRFQKESGIGIGFDVESRGIALAKALSETIERALWSDHVAYWREDSVEARKDELTGAAFAISDLAGFSAQTRKENRKLSIEEDSKFRWSKGVQLDNMSKILIPSQLVSMRYARDMDDSEPLLRESNSNGLALADSFEEAAYRGLLELIERDAFMITFFNRIPPTRIAPRSITNPNVRELLFTIETYGLAVDLLLLPTDMPTIIVCAVLRDARGGPALALGTKAHHYLGTAMRGALTEALGVWTLARFNGAYMKPIPEGNLSSVHRIAYWAKPENTAKLEWLWSGPTTDAPQTSAVKNVRELARALRKNGCSASAISMSTPLLQGMGMHAVCVVSAELQPMNLQSQTRYDGGKRLRSVPQKLGYDAAETAPPYPHPFP